jgi:hypothetical protein
MCLHTTKTMWYRKFGFEFVKAKGESATLIKKLNTENELGASSFQKKKVDLV